MKIRAIIPCAGFGTRMNMKSDESKEMLVHPHYGRLIDNSLTICRHFDLEPFVITREEKVDLISYLKKENINPVIIEPQGEWSNTIVKAYNKLEDSMLGFSILLLPDSIWSDTFNTIETMKYHFSLGRSLCVATHTVTDTSKWCVVDEYGIYLTEKQASGRNKAEAFGVLGFKDYIGYLMFNDLAVQGKYKMPDDVQFIKLAFYKDLTRGVEI